MFWCREPDDDLLSHGDPHYHWREVVSLSCSGWEGVGPTCYGRQAKTFCSNDFLGQGNQFIEVISLVNIDASTWHNIALNIFWYIKVIGSSRTSN